MDIWSDIADGRRQLTATLRELSPDEWVAQSLCGRWQVRDVVAHLVAPLVTSTPRVLGGFVLSGFNLDRFNQRLARQVGRRSNAELIQALEANATHRFTPPGRGPEAPLTDVTLHSLDIRWPLGRRTDIPESTARTVLRTLTDDRAATFVPPARVAGVRFVATDLDWASGGARPGDLAEVRGPVQALMLALTGRPAGLDELTGAGVARLRQNLRAEEE